MSSILSVENLIFSDTFTKTGIVSLGTLLVSDGTDFKLLGVGSNDNVLVADSLEPTGVKWEGRTLSPFEESSGLISSITASTNGLICGDTDGVGANVITGSSSEDSVITGGCSNTITNMINSNIIGGTGNSITGNGVSFPNRNAAIVGGDSNSMAIGCNDAVILGGSDNSISGASGNPAQCSFSIGGFSNVNFKARNCGFIGGESNMLTGTSLQNSYILGGTSNTITGIPTITTRNFIASANLSIIERYQYSVILGGQNNIIRSGILSGAPGNSFIVGGDDNRIITNTSTNSGILGGTDNRITSLTGSNIISIGGNGNRITSGSNTTAIGSNITATHSGNIILGDGSAGGISTAATDGFTAKCSGGARFFSNAAASIGVKMDAGANAWTMISDRNIKENLVELSYTDILSRVENLPIYSYNFIGNPIQQKCMGPMAQDWHTTVAPLDPIIEEIEDPENEGETITVQKDAKDKLGIETIDILGVCLASIKALIEKNNQLQSEISLLQSKNQLFEDRISNLEN